MQSILYADLWYDVRRDEASIAPGSESAMLGDYLDRMYEIGIEDPGMSDPDPDNPEFIAAGEANWWRQAYAMLERDPSQLTQDIYNSVD